MISAFRYRYLARLLQGGGIVAYPTEAVFGLGCDPLNAAAVHRLLALKRRAVAKGLVLIAADFKQLHSFVQDAAAERMTEVLASWPGPQTWLLPAAPECPAWLTGEHDTLAVRVTAHTLAADLCRAAGMPLVSTSANRTGQPPARTALAVRKGLGDELDAILAGATSRQSKPTMIRDAATGRVLRPA